ncbi:PE family protein [Mycobacterium sp.]|uniref:PE family protein n=1 Tax=Mycobacterium sp. TaxID=1785 RepID=UPI0031DA6B66
MHLLDQPRVAAVAAVSIVAAAPAVTPALPELRAPAISLTAGGVGDALEAAIQSLNSDLVGGEFSFNTGLVDTEVGLEKAIFGTDSALNGALNRSYNVVNMFPDTAENSANGVLGANADGTVDITRSLLVGVNPVGSLLPNIFNSGDIGGLEGVVDQALAGFGDITGVPPLSLLEQLQTVELSVNGTLVDTELSINTGLVHDEVALEEVIFGTDSALNGVLNRSYNVVNMVLDADEHLVNSILGAHPPAAAEITASLLAGSAAQVFNDGSIGGLEGVLGQSYLVLADFVGLLASI